MHVRVSPAARSPDWQSKGVPVGKPIRLSVIRTVLTVRLVVLVTV